VWRGITTVPRTDPSRLPVLARRWRPRHTGKIAFARAMVEAVAARHPDRRVHAVGMPPTSPPTSVRISAAFRRRSPGRPG
jgi:hypothetical protein